MSIKLTTLNHSDLQGKDYITSYNLSEITFDYINNLITFTGEDAYGDEMTIATRLVLEQK